MIPASLSSSIVPATGTITGVVQSATNATVSFWFPAAFNPFGTTPTVLVRSSPDDSTWTARGTGSIGLNGGSGSILANYIAVNEYYQVSQIVSGVQGPWSASFQFTLALATEPITPPTSVTITDVTRPFGDRYRIFFTVEQPSALSGVSGIGLSVERIFNTVSQGTTIIAGNLPGGSTSYTVDLITDLIEGSNFQLRIRNQAGGYQSTQVTSNLWDTFLEIESVVEVTASGTVAIPEWATSIGYWLYGGGGGGGGGLTVISETAIEQIGGGTAGSAGIRATGTLTSWSGTELTVTLGVGGLGRDRISGDSVATAGTNSTLHNGATLIATAAGGPRGVDGMFGDYIDVSPPVMLTGGPGETSPDVAAVSGVHALIPGAPGVPYDKDNPFLPSYSDSSSVTGGSGGYGRLAAGAITYPSSYRWAGGNGGPGACYIRFRNF